MTESKKAFAYLRVSRPEHETGSQSLKMQEERIEAYAKMTGIEIAEWFIDEGVSGGKKIREREAGGRMMERLDLGEADALVALRLDRVFRDTTDALMTMEQLDNLGVGVHLVDFGGMSLDSQSSMGRLLFTLQAAFAEFERHRIAERIRENKASRKANGRTYAVAQFGKENEEGLVVDSDAEKVLIDEMVRLYLNGLSYNLIAKQLNAKEVPTKQYGKQWYRSTVRGIVQRELSRRGLEDEPRGMPPMPPELQ